jgi:DNA-directed RNA polymerase subunit L
MISDPTAISRASKEVVDRVNGFDHIIEQRIEPASSLVEDPKNFRLGFEFYNAGSIDGAVEVVQRAITDIVERLEYLNEHIQKRTDPDRITISESDDKCTIVVRGEDDAIANLIVTYVLMRVPDIPLINYRKVHPNLRSFKLRIMHPQYMKVLTDTIAELVAMMKKLKFA